MVPLGMPWIVAIGDPLGIDQIGANEILGRDATVAVSKPLSASELPDAPIGYEGVDLVVITGSGIDVLRDLKSSQRHALTEWLIGGDMYF